MANPPLIVEQAVWNFLHQWSIGLQPCLNLTSLANGSICVKLEVSTFPSPTLQSSNNQKCRRSGRNSRSKRRIARAQGDHELSKIKTSLVPTHSDILTDVDNTNLLVHDEHDQSIQDSPTINAHNITLPAMENIPHTHDPQENDQDICCQAAVIESDAEHLQVENAPFKDADTSNQDTQVNSTEDPSWGDILRVIKDIQSTFAAKSAEELSLRIPSSLSRAAHMDSQDINKT